MYMPFSHKYLRRLTFSLLITLLVLCHFQIGNAEEGKPFVVLEFFTSEGCSSCPPADKILNDLVRIAEEKNLPIYPLGFHVDYWNYLGWEDRFSKPEYSARQKDYGYTLRNKNIYTPQVVINGQVAFEGHRRDLIDRHIDYYLNRKSKNSLKLSVLPQKSGAIEVQYRSYTVYPMHSINIVLLERNLISNITKGENAGRTLRHDNVVRQIISLPLELSGAVTINPPKTLKKENAAVMAFIQNRRSGRIVAADAIDL